MTPPFDELRIAIGMDEREDVFVKVREAWASGIGRNTFWDIELSLEERLGWVCEARREGWELEEPLY